MTETETAEKTAGKVYEVAYLVSPNVGEEKVGEVVSRVKASLEKGGAFVIADEYPRFRPLAYTLVKPLGGKNEKYTTAFFGWVKFEGPVSVLETLKADLDRDADIVRFLIVKTDREIKVTNRAPMYRRESVKREPLVKAVADEQAAPAISEAELDKTIEELIAE